MADKQVVITQQPAPQTGAYDAVFEEVRKAILSLRFGTVQIIVQDGRVVQIDKTEKIRLS